MSGTPTPGLHRARTAWLVGGSLLIAAGGVRFLATGAPTLAAAGAWAHDVLWLVALVVLAWGIGGRGSVVDRRPSGVAALTVAGVAPLAFSLAWAIMPVALWGGGDLMLFLGYLDLLTTPLALVIACVVIARAGVVPRRLRWMPLAVTAAVIAVGIAVQLVALTAATAGSQVLADVLWAAGIAPVVAEVLVGILVVTHASRIDTPPAQVYPPVSPPSR